jgi:hypothetical protein
MKKEESFYGRHHIAHDKKENGLWLLTQGVE